MIPSSSAVLVDIIFKVSLVITLFLTLYLRLLIQPSEINREWSLCSIVGLINTFCLLSIVTKYTFLLR